MLFATLKYHQSDFQMKNSHVQSWHKRIHHRFADHSHYRCITTDLITLPASQRAFVFTVIIQHILFIYTNYTTKIHYLRLHHPTFVIFCLKTRCC